MIKFMLVCSVFAAVSFAGIIPDNYVEWESRVVGGRNASLGQFPYQVSLRTGNLAPSHFCGGSIIHSRWVLSAAHCTAGQTPRLVSILVGTIRRRSGGTSLSVSRIVNHPRWNRNLLTNDISLLQTRTAIPLGPNVAIIPLASQFVGGGQQAFLSGWGQMNHPGAMPDFLQFVEKTTITNEECRELFRERAPNNVQFVHDNTICTFERAGIGACMGDSGGPLTSNGELIGAVSWGVPCARGFPDVYARVDAHRSWILENIA